MRYTKNLQLAKPSPDDFYDIAEFGNNMDILDEFYGTTMSKQRYDTNNNGAVDKADTLNTPRTFEVNLSSKTPAEFDGSENVVLGIKGVLPIEHGGTGRNTVDTTPTENSENLITSGGVFEALKSGSGGGISEYSSTKTYALNELCFLDGVIYKSLIDGNLGNDVTNTEYWEVYGGGSEGGGSGGGGTDYEQLINYTMLYDSGDECSEVSGNWAKGYTNGYGTQTFTKDKDNIYMKTIAPTSSRGSVQSCDISQKIDLSEYSKVHALFELVSASWSSAGGCIILNANDSNSTLVDKTSDNVETLRTTEAGRNKLSLDVSSLSNKYIRFVHYLGISDTAETKLYNVFLTKSDDWQKLCSLAGITAPSTLAELLADTTSLAIVFNSESAVNYMVKRCTGDFMVGVLNNSDAVALLKESPYLNMVVANVHWAKFILMIPIAHGLLNHTMLYDHGDECEDIIGGWNAVQGAATGFNSAKNSDNLYFTATGEGVGMSPHFETSNDISTVGYVGLFQTYKAKSSTLNYNRVDIPYDTQAVTNIADSATSKTFLYSTLSTSYSGKICRVIGTGGSNCFINLYLMGLCRADNFTEWASKADITPTDLDTLLADSTAMATLMSNQEAVDYLAGCTGDLMVAICNSEVAMSALVNNIAYDTLFKHPVWYKFMTMCPVSLSAMDSVAVTVPTMTSNTAPSGEVVSSGYYDSTYYPYLAFDKNINTMWCSQQDSNNKYIGYVFEQDIECYKLSIIQTQTANSNIGSFVLKCGDSVDNLQTVTELDAQGTSLDYILEKPVRAKCWVLDNCVRHDGQTAYNGAVRELNFYGKVVSE